MKRFTPLFLLFLSGCLSMTNTEKKENLIAFPSLEKSQNLAINSSIFERGNWPDTKWWTQFESPILNSWIEEAFSKNPNLQLFASSIERARQVAKVKESKLFHTLYFNAADNYHYFSERAFFHELNPSLPLHGYEVDLSLTFNYEFDFWSKNRNMFRAAIGEMKAKQAELCQAQLMISTSLAQAYFALMTTIKKKDLYQNLVEINQTRLDLQKKLNEGALVSLFPPLLNEEELDNVKQLLIDIEYEIQIQKHLINILMGKGPDEDLPLETALLNPPKQIPLPSELSIELLSRRPDLMAQIWRAEALANEVGVAKAEFYPNINLAAFAGLASTDWSQLFLSSSKSLAYLPTISLPMFTAGAIRANIRAKKAAFDEAIFAYNNLLLTCAQEVSDLLCKVQIAYQQKDLQNKIVNDAKKRLDLTLMRLEGGLDSEFNVLDFKEALVNKQIQDLDLLYHQYAYLIKFIKSLGGGYHFSSIPIALGDDHD